MALSGTFFDASYYITQYSDVAANWSGSALDHYTLYGAAENRTPNTWFNAQYYRANNSDLQSLTAIELFEHYESFGYMEGRVPSSAYATFDEATYLSTYSDLGDGGITEGTALNHFLVYGAGEGRTAQNDDGTPVQTDSSSTGSVFSLTTAVDSFTGTSNDDTFVADNVSNSVLGAADTLIGGAGTDTLKVYSGGGKSWTVAETVTGIENLYINGESTDIDTVTNGFTGLEIDNASTTAAGADTITVGASTIVTLDSITDGDTGDDANDKGEIEITGASTVTSASLVVDGVGAATSTTHDLDVDITSANITALTVQSKGTQSSAKNYLGIQNSGGALETLTITGDKLLDAKNDAVSTLKTIDASASTGGVKVNTTGSTLDVKFTGGSGDDTFIIGADLDTNDTIDGGAGTDTVVVTDAALNSSTSAVGKGINALTNVEVVGSSVTAADGVQIDATKFSSVNAFAVGAGGALAPATQNGAGDDAVALTFGDADDSLIVSANITGGASTDGAGVGGDAIDAAASVNSGSDTLNLTFSAGAATSITGGAASAGASDGGIGLNAATVENINITTASASDDITFAGGSSAGGNAGASVSVGANATITITGAGDVNLGTIVTQGAAVDDLTIDGSGMTGVLTVGLGAGNDIVKGGSKADVLTIGTTAATAAGTNTVTGNGGADQFKFAIGTSTSAELTSITDFAMGAGNDIIDVTGKTATYEAVTSANASAIAADTTLAAALTQAFTQLATDEATAFVWNGDAYVVYEDGSNAGAYNAAEDLVVKLSGVTDISTFDATNIV